MIYQLSVNWGPRVEDLSECAERVGWMLERLSRQHPTPKVWFKRARTRAAAFKPFCEMPPRQAELEAILKTGRFFTSGSHELVPALGYPVGAWNGLDEPHGLSFRVTTGAYSNVTLYPNEASFPTLSRETTHL